MIMKSYLISEHIVMEEVTETQCVVYECDSGQFYELNEEATFVLKNFRNECTIDDILKCIKTVVQIETFDEKQVKLRLEQFIKKCLERKLLKEADA